MDEPTTVLVADDNSVVRSVLREMLHGQGPLSVVGEAGDGERALELASTLRPDVTLLDHRMPRRDGLSVIASISAHSRVLMLTRTVDEDVVLAAIRAGAAGYLVHGQFGPAELRQAIQAVAGGEAHLSPTAARVLVSSVRRAPEPRTADRHGLSRREREVMELIAGGLSNGAIANRLVVAVKTVENHVNRVFAKLGARTRDEATAIWRGPRRRA
ncbi:DNA-binding response regulator [Catellatospora methionotrophica]|uniref:DNA-binding response regulator n=1 Tax=Catellatospora methionotrophica TaxID=121620 RepID=A0A8J3LCA5_9ACTN|nr:response regulator transcription factor [Catellatospora methionotrophica]GIG16477.1 DNA-binding response regulator [Catellatospora methionotrophica]